MPETGNKVWVSLSAQRLALLQGDALIDSWPVSTARAGAGQLSGSEATPLGRHLIRARIGEGAQPGAVFVGRRQTGEVWTPELHRRHPERDWILTRILWLSGVEPGTNRLGEVDSMRRYIYIHGTPDIEPLGVPLSHGCVRMSNAAIVELFDQVKPGTAVELIDGDLPI